MLLGAGKGWDFPRNAGCPNLQHLPPQLLLLLLLLTCLESTHLHSGAPAPRGNSHPSAAQAAATTSTHLDSIQPAVLR